MENNVQQPVAWVWQFPDGDYYEISHRDKNECERDCCGYDGMAVPLYTAHQARIAELEANNTALLALLAKIREACGDNGKRMQDELVAYIAGLHRDATSLRIFAAKVAKQEPEKPDYWNSCGQCERNASDADDLIGNDK